MTASATTRCVELQVCARTDIQGRLTDKFRLRDAHNTHSKTVPTIIVTNQSLSPSPWSRAGCAGRAGGVVEGKHQRPAHHHLPLPQGLYSLSGFRVQAFSLFLNQLSDLDSGRVIHQHDMPNIRFQRQEHSICREMNEKLMKLQLCQWR